ncbi:fumarylacetoacetate hydrolase family protein [Arthrobacter alpinus]|uniref:fumarylacetoacetate hydrolase family protein n=1 Tax=Arthrobacter alpinus TaxID=656366 RepID=UPI0007803D4D|nr:fumarylacetoacetate hydrolase family protein [Arthrobacter alpinus]
MSTVTQETLSGAGKVIAVEENYRGLAEQRGRFPEMPSYFLKPPSSLSLSGGTVERPAGLEKLSLAGEVALIIGTVARHVSMADAWGHIAFVTAANHLCLDELASAQKGSTLLATGGDGFTPLGHFLLDASRVDPEQLELRTWVNGTLVQDDTTAGLLFPINGLIAELSQVMTLMPGDVILTGTPAGSGLVVPGDTMEVSVVDPASGESTGRLHTTVTAGTVPLPTFGARGTVHGR